MFFFLSDALFLSGFSPRKDLSVRKLLFIRFPSQTFFCQKPLLSVRFLPSKNTFFLSEISSFVSGFTQKCPSCCQKSPSFCQVSFPEKTFLSEIPFFVSGFSQNRPFFLSEIAFFLSCFSLRKDLLSVRYLLLSVRFPSEHPSFCQ